MGLDKIQRKVIVVALLMIAIVIAAATPTLAQSEIDKKMKELTELNATIEKYEKQFNQKSKEANQVIGQINDLEKNMNTLEKEINSLEGQIIQTQQDIELLEIDITETTLHLDERNEFLNRRLVQIYQQGDVTYLEVIFSATSFTDFLTRFDLIERVAEKDIELIREVQGQRNLLLIQKSDLEIKTEKLLSIKDQSRSKHQQMELQSEQKQSLLVTIEQEKDTYAKALDELEESQKELEVLIRELQSKNTSPYMDSGTMAWPTPGHTRITSEYGMRPHPILKSQRFHAGIDIAAPKGATVIAAAKGSVIFAGIKSGWGNCIIIDHGGAVSTQYSHLSKISVKVGALVDKGSKIGEVGSTGLSTGNHLDFMVRINGDTVDPLNHALYYVKP